MFYDLNVPWSSNHAELQRTLSFLAELDYNVIALNHSITGKIPADLTCPITFPLPFTVPSKLHILTRLTLHLSDPAQNHRLSSLASHYTVLALRPTNEKALLLACQSPDCDIISLDLSQRFPFHFKYKTFSIALSRGIRIELCYAAGVGNADGGISRRNLISNATSLVRATRGKGIIISSEVRRALECRGPFDIVNLGVVWGLPQERGHEAVGREARAVVVQAEMKRRSFRGVVDVVYGGEKPVRTDKTTLDAEKQAGGQKDKRKASAMENGYGKKQKVEEEKPVSKRELKRREKKARLEAQESAQTSGGKIPASLEAAKDPSMKDVS